MIRNSSNDWQEVNDDINFIEHKKNRFKKKKLLVLLATLSLAITASGVGGYFFISSMVKAFNFNNFKTPDVDLDGVDFNINMDLVPIENSKNNLRLQYFEDNLKIKVFNYLKTVSWWKLFFSTNPDDFIFSWYKHDSESALGAVDVAQDGLDESDLELTVKNSSYSFRIHVNSFIYNTAKFYEKFMIFNRFETIYDEVDNNLNPIINHIAQKGYLSQSHSIKDNEVATNYNNKVYQAINERINIFSSNENQELVSTTGQQAFYPVLTSIAPDLLQDIDVDNLDTLRPYVPLVNNPANTYYDIAGKYQQLTNSSKFSIIYSPIPDLIEKIIKSGVSDVEGLERFLKNNHLKFIPFAQNNLAKTPTSGGQKIKYTTPHNVILKGDEPTKELTQYIYHASNTINVLNFKVEVEATIDRNIAALNIYLRNQVWKALREQFSYCFNALSLMYPNTAAAPDDNFNYLNQSPTNFENYFKTAFNNDPSVGKITYYDNDNQILNLPPDTHPIPYQKISHFSVAFGPDVVISSNYGAQSFSFFFKILWK